MSGWAVGQEVIIFTPMHGREPLIRKATITKVGRKWVQTNICRFDHVSGHVDIYQTGREARAYRDAAHLADEKAKAEAWESIRELTRFRDPSAALTREQVETAARLLLPPTAQQIPNRSTVNKTRYGAK